jgi:hypothetical protein
MIREVFVARYPAFKEAHPDSSFVRLEEAGLIKVDWQTTAVEITDEEGLAAAHAAEVLRRQGAAESLVEKIQSSIADRLRNFIGSKMTANLAGEVSREVSLVLAGVAEVDQCLFDSSSFESGRIDVSARLRASGDRIKLRLDLK